MTHEEKVALYLATLAEDRPRRGASSLWAILWRLGVKIPPPEFINPPLVFLILTLYLVFIFFVCGPILLMVYDGEASSTSWTLFAHSPFTLILLFICMLGATFGALAADASARRHGFGSWSEFGAAAPHSRRDQH